MTLYRKKPVEVEAFQVGVDPLPSWFVDHRRQERLRCLPGSSSLEFPAYRITTLEGEMLAGKGDFVIKGVEGELYPCKESIFKATYEKV